MQAPQGRRANHMLDQSLISQLGPLKAVFENPLLLGLLIAWILAWKGVALWNAARLSHKWWFIILLIANTVGILEIIYIFFIARKYTVETSEVTEEALEK